MNNITKKVSDKKVLVGNNVSSVLLDKPISKRAKYTDYDLTSKLKFSQLEHSIYLHNELHQSKHNTASGGSNGSSTSSSSNSSYGNHTGNNSSGSSSSSSSSDVHRNSGSSSGSSSNSSSDLTGAISDGSDKQIGMPLTESNLAMNDPMSYCAKQRRR